MEGVNSEDVGVPAASSVQPESPQSNNDSSSVSSPEPIDFDAEAAALAEEEAFDQDEIDLDEALTPGPEREDQDVRIPLCGRRKGTPSGAKRLVKKDKPQQPTFTPQQRLLMLDTWQRSGLPAKDFGTLVGVTNHTLYAWKKAFDEEGHGGLMDKPRGGPRGMKLHELTKRTILMLKEKNPEWGASDVKSVKPRAAANHRGPKGPRMNEASREARKVAAAILEVMGGARLPSDAAKALSISLPRYYLLESRALNGLLFACEPRRIGRVRSAESERTAARKEVQQLQQECARYSALVRAAQRTIGLSQPQPFKPGENDKGKRCARRA